MQPPPSRHSPQRRWKARKIKQKENPFAFVCVGSAVVVRQTKAALKRVDIELAQQSARLGHISHWGGKRTDGRASVLVVGRKTNNMSINVSLRLCP